MGLTKTYVLLAGLSGLFGAIGFALGGASGAFIALMVATAMNIYTYYNAHTIVLRMYKAREVSPADIPYLYQMTENLAHNANMPMPKLYIMDNAQPNAFATGRSPEHGVVAVTTGLLQLLSKDEVEGVVAHELAHIANRDSLIMTMTATIAGAIGMIANSAMWFGMMGGNSENRTHPLLLLLMSILAPIAAMLVQMAISRTREYAADKRGAEICQNPLALASALQKIEAFAKGTPNIQAENNPATAHLFVINPLGAHKVDSLFSTHPATATRVAALRTQAEAMGFSGGLSGGFSSRSASPPANSTPRSPWG